MLSADIYSEEHSDSPIISITFPEEGKLRSRTVVSRSRARATGKYPSWKMDRMIEWESCHELNAYRLLDANPYVISYFEQPLVIRYIQDDIVHLHYPDALVQWQDYHELWEIKTASDAIKPENIQRTQLLEHALPKLGYRYRLLIAEDFAREPRLFNALTLLKFGRNPVSSLAEEQLRQIIEVTSSIRWGSILNGAMGPEGRKLICRLVLEGVLTFDIEQPLSDETCFFWVKGNNVVASWRL